MTVGPSIYDTEWVSSKDHKSCCMLKLCSNILFVGVFNIFVLSYDRSWQGLLIILQWSRSLHHKHSMDSLSNNKHCRLGSQHYQCWDIVTLHLKPYFPSQLIYYQRSRMKDVPNIQKKKKQSRPLTCNADYLLLIR